ncbi:MULTISPECIES: hypothetical protein [unclassified Paenibacillus]|uniref:hypothetical protein n=1 Tax=unclassified Paenibacillus TaxID=185978 RepID=UPI002F41ABC2
MGKSANKPRHAEKNKEQPTAGFTEDTVFEGRDSADMDIDRMVNEGLGGGNITLHNGFIDHSTTDTMTEEE